MNDHRATYDRARQLDPRSELPPALHLLNLAAAWGARERQLMAEEMHHWHAPALVPASAERRLAGQRAHAQGEYWAVEYGLATGAAA